ESHRRRLRHTKELGDLAGHVLVDVRLARQSPALVDLVLAQLAVVGGGDIGRGADNANFAFAAGAAASARGVDWQPDPVRGTEDSGARRNPRGPVERQIGDLELLLDHWVEPALAAISFSSAR